RTKDEIENLLRKGIQHINNQIPVTCISDESESVDYAISNAPFNSLTQLVSDRGFPRNPMINSGAITLADKLPGKNPSDRTQKFCQWLNQLADCDLKLDEQMLASVRSVNSQTNQAIAQYLAEAGYVDDIKTALDTYEQICCLSGKVEDLACLGKLLSFNYEIEPQNRRCVNALMLTCGLYEASAKYSVRIGLPMKSGISGALLTIVPTLGAIATYSPALDNVGNSVAGLAFIEALSENFQLSPL
ncbi:MAG: glutaminase, partial [Tolypothrix sp. T3-bin4]|nr:glutaminase [Tolypothrix sp. T3-bin4]